MYSYRGIGCEEVALGDLGAVDTNAIAAAGAGLLTTYFNTQDAKAKAKADAAAAKRIAAEAARNASSMNRWVIAGVAIGGAFVLALVVIAVAQKGVAQKVSQKGK